MYAAPGLFAPIVQLEQLSPMPRILTICGSLRAKSINAIVLAAAEVLASERADFDRYESLGELPHFNPDLEQNDLPPLVHRLRELVGKSDGVLICAPEYAHAMPAVLKNALEWLVGGGEMVGKSVAVINTSARAFHAHEQILEVLRMLSAEVGEYSTIFIPIERGAPPLSDLLADLDFSQKLAESLERFIDRIS